MCGICAVRDISDYAIRELREVTERKFPNKVHEMEHFIGMLPFCTVCVNNEDVVVPDIRDEKDKPILAAAIASKSDVLLTGDKDFGQLDMRSPSVMTMREFISAYRHKDYKE